MIRFAAIAAEQGRRAIVAAIGLALLGCALAASAAAQGDPEVGPLPKGDGEIRVRVVHADGSAAPGLPVVLYALPPDAAPGLARSETDDEGRASFRGVATDPAVAYLVGVRSGEVPYGQRVAFEGGAQTVEVPVEVAATTADASMIRRDPGFVRIDRGCDTLEVTETHPLANPTDRVVHIPVDQRASRPPLLELQLPLQAGPLRSALGPLPQGVERDGRTLRFWGPVYPGSQELELSYGLPAGDADMIFQWRFPGGAPGLSFLAPAEAVELVIAMPKAGPIPLEASPPRNVGGSPYAVLRSGALAPEAELELQVRLATPEAPPITVEETRVWIELDDAVLAASERHQLAVAGGDPVAAGPAPALCLPLPVGAEDLRFDENTLAMGPVVGASGVLAFRGPIPAGESALALSYQIPLAGGAAVFARRFPLDVPLLEMFVSDTGVRPRTDRLHRLRPIRNADRNYLHLQGFGLRADEELRIEFERLPARRGLPRMAALGFGLLAAGASFAFLLGPLRSARPEEIRAPSRADEIKAEREAVYAVIRDLDEDFETGKLSAEDHASMRGEMRERAVALLRQERAAAASPARTPTPAEQASARPPRFCTECGESLPKRARFCPQCGTKTGAAGA